MQRTIGIVVGALLLGGLVWLAAQRQAPAPEPHSLPTPTASPATASSANSKVEPDGGRGLDAGTTDADASGVTSLAELFPDGKVPDLPKGSPRSARLGVILFSHEEAERAAKDARSKAAALKLARQVLPEAKEDFKAAAKKGDRGSAAKAGKIPRGVLEPAVEYVLFTLKKGEVYSEPLDTPRGYWVIRRY